MRIALFFAAFALSIPAAAYALISHTRPALPESEAGVITVASDEETASPEELQKLMQERDAQDAKRETCQSWPVVSGPVQSGIRFEICQTGGKGAYKAFVRSPDNTRVTAPEGKYRLRSYIGTITVFAGETCKAQAPCGVTPKLPQ